MIPRILAISVLCSLLLAGFWWLSRPVSPAAAVAAGVGGERWYNLTLNERHLGYWYTWNRQDEDGNWVFEGVQRFAMDAANPVSTTARRTFSNQPPHPLLHAEYLQTGRRQSSGVRVEATPGGYRAVQLGDYPGPATALEWRYSMTDYLDFELWLENADPAPGSSRAVASLDFDRIALVRRSFNVVEQNSDGYVIENAAPLSATRIQLDGRYVPLAIDIAGLFELRLSSREQALAPRSVLQAASYYIPTSRRLLDHTRIARLELTVSGHESPGELFNGIRQDGDRWTLELHENPTSKNRVRPADLQETLSIPSTHPEMTALAAKVTAGLDGDLIRARALNRFVNRFLEYRPGIPPHGMLELLEVRQGDCTEFADLLTTLARSAGLPSRTVFGLAYADGDLPAFAYHAWNEIFIDDAWVAMDPTWGQDRVDATHIPLPEDEAAALMLLTGSVDLQFTVADVDYFQG